VGQRNSVVGAYHFQQNIFAGVLMSRHFLYIGFILVFPMIWVYSCKYIVIRVLAVAYSKKICFEQMPIHRHNFFLRLGQEDLKIRDMYYIRQTFAPPPILSYAVK